MDFSTTFFGYPETMRLSEAFEKECTNGEFEWSAKVYNLNAEENSELLEGCAPLAEYTEVVHRIDSGWDTTLNNVELFRKIDEIVAGCIMDGLLADILSKNRAEVVDMCIQEIEQKKFENSLRKVIRDECMEECLTQGRAEGVMLLQKLLQKITPDSDDYKTVIAADDETLAQLAQKYNIEYLLDNDK